MVEAKWLTCKKCGALMKCAEIDEMHATYECPECNYVYGELTITFSRNGDKKDSPKEF